MSFKYAIETCRAPAGKTTGGGYYIWEGGGRVRLVGRGYQVYTCESGGRDLLVERGNRGA